MFMWIRTKIAVQVLVALRSWIGPHLDGGGDGEGGEGGTRGRHGEGGPLYVWSMELYTQV